MAELGNPQNTIEVLQKYRFNFQKKFGQNFLIDTHVLDKIIDASGVTEDDFVLEIGPGIGTMTQYLCERAREVVAVEIDKNLIPILSDTLKNYSNVTVINEDILKLDIKKLADEKNEGRPIKVVANCIFLCYNHFRTNVLICPVLFMITEENSSTQLLLGIFIKLTMEDGWLEACLVFFLWKSGTVHRRTDA